MGAALSALSTNPAVFACAVGVIVVLWAFTKPEDIDPCTRPVGELPVQRSKPVPGEPGARMSPLVDELVEYIEEDMRTLYDVVQRGARHNKSKECLGTRTADGYSFISYETMIERSRDVGSGLLKLGASIGQSSKIGIFSQNRVEYLLTEYGCYTYSMVAVPLYDTLGEEAVDYILQHTDIKYIVVDVAAKIDLLLKHEAGKRLHAIICMTDVQPELQARVKAAGIQFLLFDALEALGRANQQPAQPPSPDDLCVICYTSGTTGMPKGVMSTHSNYVASISSVHVVGGFENEEETHLSYLPLAHSYERFALFFLLSRGSRICFFGGDVKGLLEDLQAARPTVFCAVPRLLNRIYDKVNAGVQNGGFIKRTLFNLAYNQKLKAMNRGHLAHDTLWDKLVFAKISALLGGQVKSLATGAAPLSLAVMDFSRIALRAKIQEGYGQTESSALLTSQLPGETRAGNVGSPAPCCMVKLCDIPEMDYFADNNQGEVCVKGFNVFKGYYRCPEKTAEAVDKDGWLHTGDIGQWTKDWSLRIIDRKKHIFKLSQGEYIAPEKIENFYIRSGAIAQMFVYGDSLKDSLVGIAFVDPENIVNWANTRVGVNDCIKDLCSNATVVKAVLDDLITIGKEAGLKTFEQVKAIHLHPELMTPENDLLTPTLKAKRTQIKKHFQNVLDNLYQKL